MGVIVTSGALATPTTVPLEIRAPAPGWHVRERAEADAPHRVTLYLDTTAEAQARLEEAFWAVADPKSPRYAQYLSLDELARLGACMTDSRVLVCPFAARETPPRLSTRGTALS